MIKRILFIVFFWFSPGFSLGGKEVTSDKQPELISYSVSSCRHEYNADFLVNHIVYQQLENGQLFISILFAENCCAKFNPGINFSKGCLYVQTYVSKPGPEEKMATCGCNCSYMMKLLIGNFTDTSFVTIFRNQRIYLSDEPYKLQLPRYELHDNDTINRTNKYGTAVGVWKYYYDDGKLKSEDLYPDNSVALYPILISTKKYFEDGRLAYYQRKDSSESWFRNGKLEKSVYEWNDNGDRMKLTTEYFENGRLKEKEKERTYSADHAPLDSITGGRSMDKIEIHEKYYENGQPALYQGTDSTNEWYESGRIKSVLSKGVYTEYYESGSIKKKQRYWYSYTDYGHPLNNMFWAEYDQQGGMSYLLLVRDEPAENGVLVGIRYEWKWGENGEMIKQPPNWEGPLPE